MTYRESNDFEKAIIGHISSLVDEYSGKDYVLMSKLEDFAFDILNYIDGGCPEWPQFELKPLFAPEVIIVRELHHYFLKDRFYKSPILRKRAKEGAERHAEKNGTDKSHQSLSRLVFFQANRQILL